MPAWTQTLRRSTWRTTLACCTSCRVVQPVGPRCAWCDAESGALVVLQRGLGSLEDPERTGFIRYQGDRLTNLLIAGLLGLLPIAGVVAYLGQPPVAVVLLLLAFIGLPAVALLDARRAGAAARDGETFSPRDDRQSLPEVVPSPMLSGPHPRARQAEPFHGKVRRTDTSITAPISGHAGVALRCDVRVGDAYVVLARHLDAVEFLVEREDGSSVWVTGPIALEAPVYGRIAHASQATLTVDDVQLLPATFSAGGWLCELLLRENDTVEVHAEPTGEVRAHPLGGYRTAAAVPLVEGRADAPVRVRIVPGRAASSSDV